MKNSNYYKNLYDKFISTRKKRKQKKSFMEKHHILPKCQGGLDIEENYVLLTHKEHYFAHLMLHKANPKNLKLKFALSAMIYGSRKKNRRALNSRSYQRIKTIMTIPIPERDILEKMYFNQNMSYKKIGDYFKVSDMTVCSWFKLYKIKAKQSVDYLKFKLPKKEKLKGKTPKNIKKEYNVGLTTVYQWLKHYNLTPKRVIGIKKQRPSSEELVKMYKEQRLTIKKIATNYNVSPGLVRVWFKEFNITKY